MNLFFSSTVRKECRSALEDLLFFNPRQSRVRQGIINAVERFGHLHLDETAGGLSIRVGDHEAQSLFAYDQDRRGGDPIGVVVFLRPSPEEIAIIHVAVHPDYALHSPGAAGLGAVLIEKVKEIASRIVGVQRILLFYRQEIILRVNT